MSLKVLEKTIPNIPPPPPSYFTAPLMLVTIPPRSLNVASPQLPSSSSSHQPPPSLSLSLSLSLSTFPRVIPRHPAARGGLPGLLPGGPAPGGPAHHPGGLRRLQEARRPQTEGPAGVPAVAQGPPTGQRQKEKRRPLTSELHGYEG